MNNSFSSSTPNSSYKQRFIDQPKFQSLQKSIKQSMGQKSIRNKSIMFIDDSQY